MTPQPLDLWRRLHELADRMHDAPRPLLVHVDQLVARLERLLDGTDDTPTPKKGTT